MPAKSHDGGEVRVARTWAAAVGLFAADLSALGVPGNWFLLNIGASRSPFAYAQALPLLGLLIGFAIKSRGYDTPNRRIRRCAPMYISHDL